MVANVETMMFKGELPWHGLGTKIEDNKVLSIDEGLISSGCDWEVHLEDLFTAGGLAAPARGVVRSTDSSMLGVVGPRYTPLQNRKAFEWFQPFLDAGACELHTAGSLCGGAKVWVLAKLVADNCKIVDGDEVAKFIMLSNSHDGTTAVRVGFTPIRVVCANTMAMAHNSAASKLIRVRHSSKMSIKLDVIREIMNLANQEFEATADQYRQLACRTVCAADLRKYVKLVLEVDEKADEGDLSTRTKNNIDKIMAMAISGIGSTIPGVGGTWWQAYNGVTQYLSYNAGNNANNRMNNLWFGQGVNMNSNALKIALQMAG